MILRPENGSISPDFIVERDKQLKHQNTQSFFTELRALERINSIYYPGPGLDDSLNGVFLPSEITYIDRTPYFENVSQGDFRTKLLPPDSVDAVFLQDVHPTRKDIDIFLAALRKNGILVFSLYGCGMEGTGAVNHETLKSIPTLREEEILRNWQNLFRTFRKVS